MNFREVNDDDILKKWYICMEELYLCYVDEQDKANELNWDKYYDDILKLVPKDVGVAVQDLLDLLYEDFMHNLDYWTEKYYRNGFCDGAQLASGSLKR